MHTIIFRTTNECNLRCKYCYDANNHDNEISKNIATKTFLENEKAILQDMKKILNGEKRPKIIFHGGEPLLVDANVLDDFCGSLLKEMPARLSIQTNGTLINEDTIKLFEKYNINVGLSLDGANEYQNSARIFKSGKNSFSTVMEKIKLLNAKNVHFGIIISINKLHLGAEKELYDFIADNNLNCNIRPVYSSLNGDNSLVMSSDEYIMFFKNLYDIWYNDSQKRVSTRQINEFYKELKKVVTNDYRDRICECSNSCFLDFISLDPYGELYSCNRLYNIPEFYYGNIRNMSMDEVKKKAERLALERLIYVSDECKECNIFNKCYGGCPAEAYSSYGTINHKSDFCLIRKNINQYIKEKIK